VVDREVLVARRLEGVTEISTQRETRATHTGQKK
jgi:hypothetical protein